MTRSTVLQRELLSLPAIYQRPPEPAPVKLKKVAIVGFASSTRHLAPYGDPEWEIWGLNNAYDWMPRATRWFELHDRWKFPQAWEPAHLTRMQKFECPIYTVEAYEDIPQSVVYPRAAVAASGRDYFTSSIAFMLALAYHEGFTHISVYGCEMLLDSEYAMQRPCLEYWIGKAEDRGARVFVPPQSGLMQANYVYGYDPRPEEGPIKRFAVEQRVATYERDMKMLLEQQHTISGAMGEGREIVKGLEVGWDLDQVKVEIGKRVEHYQRTLEQSIAKLHMLNGAKEEAEHSLTMIKHWERGGQVPGPLETGD